jgi:hypothetical protein
VRWKQKPDRLNVLPDCVIQAGLPDYIIQAGVRAGIKTALNSTEIYGRFELLPASWPKGALHLCPNHVLTPCRAEDNELWK